MISDDYGRFQEAILEVKFLIEDGLHKAIQPQDHVKGRSRGKRTLAIMGLGALVLGSKFRLELLKQLAEAGEGRVATILGAPHGHGDEGQAIRRSRRST
jgi:hypothetical protein